MLIDRHEFRAGGGTARLVAAEGRATLAFDCFDNRTRLCPWFHGENHRPDRPFFCQTVALPKR